MCIEGLPEDAERSVKGAIHLRPGQSLDLTDDEYAFIQAQRPELKKHIVLLKEMPKKK